MTHEEVWRALDTLAAEKGLSVSGLARAAGLDPTSFNPSKRAGPDGRPRWPSTESLSRVLAATGTTLQGFAQLVAGAATLGQSGFGARRRRLPVIAFSRLTTPGLFDRLGRPEGPAWDEAELPVDAAPGCFAVRVDGASFEPCYRAEAMLLLDPGRTPRPGDRALLRRPNLLSLGVLRARPGGALQLLPLPACTPPLPLAAAEATRLPQVIWASQ